MRLSAISKNGICLLALAGSLPAITGCGPDVTPAGAKPAGGKPGRQQAGSYDLPGAEESNPAEAKKE